MDDVIGKLVPSLCLSSDRWLLPLPPPPFKDLLILLCRLRFPSSCFYTIRRGFQEEHLYQSVLSKQRVGKKDITKYFTIFNPRNSSILEICGVRKLGGRGFLEL